MPVKYCIPVIPSADLEKSLRLWVDGLGFSTSSEMRKDGKLIFCMLRKDDLHFMLNQRAGNAIKPEDYDGIRRRRIYTKPESDWRALVMVFQNSKIESTARPSFFLPTMTAFRIASASLHKDRHLQQQNWNCESGNFNGALEPIEPLQEFEEPDRTHQEIWDWFWLEADSWRPTAGLWTPRNDDR
jgi:hypothetical protein